MWCFATLLCAALLQGASLGAEEGEAAAAEPLFTSEEWQRAGERSQGVGAGRDRRGQPIEDGQMATSVVRMVFALVMVVGLAVAAAYLAKRFGLHRRLPGQRGEHMEVLESLSIGPKRMVTLLRVGNHHVVIGHGEHAMASLASYPLGVPADAEGVAAAAPGPAAVNTPESANQPSAAPVQDSREQAPNVDDFRQRLNRLLGRQGS